MTLTPKEFLQIEIEKGMSADNPAFRELARLTISKLKPYDIRTILDYGAGTGVYSNAAHDAGYQVYAYEIWKEHRDYIIDRFPNVLHTIKPINTDAMLFIEVAEHMTDNELDKLMGSINPEIILFSSTPHHNPSFDEEWGHINIKQPEEWDAFFYKYAYKVNQLISVPTLWTRVYKKIF